ncbi:MAG: hypothetical protein ACYT04_79700, partial [Nostoc sp.]
PATQVNAPNWTSTSTRFLKPETFNLVSIIFLCWQKKLQMCQADVAHKQNRPPCSSLTVQSEKFWVSLDKTWLYPNTRN